MMKLDDVSPYIVKVIEVIISAVMIMKNESKIKLEYVMVDELCTKGDLYHFWRSSGFLNEPHARYYFKQMIEGLEAIHKKGLAHRDIKLENILLDENFNVKISDFGYAGPISRRTGDGLMNTVHGTPEYIAPEIYEENIYKAEIADVFSIGVVIFILVIGLLPFSEAKRNEDYYSKIYNRNWKDYW